VTSRSTRAELLQALAACVSDNDEDFVAAVLKADVEMLADDALELVKDGPPMSALVRREGQQRAEFPPSPHPRAYHSALSPGGGRGEAGGAACSGPAGRGCIRRAFHR
jgi:hypothetical protein